MQIKCPVCEANDTHCTNLCSRQGLGTFRIYECVACTHRFIVNGPTDEELRLHDDRVFCRDKRLTRPPRTAWRDRALARTVVDLLPRRAKVLDIGANFGETLLAMPHTYSLEGVELSASAAAAASRNRRLTVHHGFFESIAAGLVAHTFDCVIALAVIEHIRHPKVFLGEIVRLLRPGGLAVIMTGDYASWNAQRLGTSWALYHGDGHFHFFSARSLSSACLSAGLEVYSSLWVGPNPFTYRFPRPIDRALHCQTTTMLMPSLFGRRAQGDILYFWCVNRNQAAGRVA